MLPLLPFTTSTDNSITMKETHLPHSTLQTYNTICSLYIKTYMKKVSYRRMNTRKIHNTAITDIGHLTSVDSYSYSYVCDAWTQKSVQSGGMYV